MSVVTKRDGQEYEITKGQVIEIVNPTVNLPEQNNEESLNQDTWEPEARKFKVIVSTSVNTITWSSELENARDKSPTFLAEEKIFCDTFSFLVDGIEDCQVLRFSQSPNKRRKRSSEVFVTFSFQFVIDSTEVDITKLNSLSLDEAFNHFYTYQVHLGKLYNELGISSLKRSDQNNQEKPQAPMGDVKSRKFRFVINTSVNTIIWSSDLEKFSAYYAIEKSPSFLAEEKKFCDSFSRLVEGVEDCQVLRFSQTPYKRRRRSDQVFVTFSFQFVIDSNDIDIMELNSLSLDEAFNYFSTNRVDKIKLNNELGIASLDLKPPGPDGENTNENQIPPSSDTDSIENDSEIPKANEDIDNDDDEKNDGNNSENIQAIMDDQLNKNENKITPPSYQMSSSSDTDSIENDSEKPKLTNDLQNPEAPNRDQLGDKNNVSPLINDQNNQKRRKRSTPTVTIPTNFDLRKHEKCGEFISSVRNQGKCETCWAVAPLKAIASSLCMVTGGSVKKHLSPQHMRTCCNSKNLALSALGIDPCTSDHCNAAGYPSRAYDFFRKNGVVTGSDANNDLSFLYGSGCQRYPVQGSALTHLTVDANDNTLSTCQNTCTSNPVLNFASHKIGGTPGTISQIWYTPDNANVKRHIMLYGPMTLTFEVFDSFMSYTGGIYSQDDTTLKSVGWHTMVVIGWGQENGVDYWLCANSYGEFWGESGFIKIKMGTSQSHKYAFAGIKWTCSGKDTVNHLGQCSGGGAGTSYTLTNLNTCDHDTENEIVITTTPDAKVRNKVCKSELASTKFSILNFQNELSQSVDVYRIDVTGTVSSTKSTIAAGRNLALKDTIGQAYAIKRSGSTSAIFLVKTIKERTEANVLNIKIAQTGGTYKITTVDGSVDFSALNEQV